MKKILLYISIITILFTITGCNKENKDKINNTFPSKIAEYEYGSTINCEAFQKNIKYFDSEGWLVTSNNEVYVYNINQLYSNGTNCKKIDEEFDNIILVDKDYDDNSGLTFGKTSYYNDNNQKVSVDTDNFKIVRIDRSNGYKKDIPADLAAMKDKGYKKYQKSEICSAYAIKEDNNIYGLHLSNFVDYETLDYSVIGNEQVVFSVDEDETIIDFYYASDGVIANAEYPCFADSNIEPNITQDIGDKFILTNKSYYRPMLVDKECTKYADVNCEYEWQKDNELSKIRNDIVFRDISILITKNGRVYYNTEVDFDVNN